MQALHRRLDAVSVDDDSQIDPRCAERHHLDLHVSKRHQCLAHRSAGIADSRADDCDDTAIALYGYVAQVAQTDWGQLVDFCQGMEQSANSVTVQVVQAPPPPQLKAA